MPSRILPAVLGIFHSLSCFDNFTKVVLQVLVWWNGHPFVWWNGYPGYHPFAHGVNTAFEAVAFDNRIRDLDQLPCWYMYLSLPVAGLILLQLLSHCLYDDCNARKCDTHCKNHLGLIPSLIYHIVTAVHHTYKYINLNQCSQIPAIEAGFWMALLHFAIAVCAGKAWVDLSKHLNRKTTAKFGI